MKHIALYLLLLFVLPISCKSHQHVSRSVDTVARRDSLTSVSDSLVTHRETTHNTEGAQQQNRVEYSKIIDFTPDSNVATITEKVVFINSKFDFNSQFKEVDLNEFQYKGNTIITDTISNVVREENIRKKDNRLIQGWEWLIVLFGAVGFVIALNQIYRLHKERRS